MCYVDHPLFSMSPIENGMEDCDQSIRTNHQEEYKKKVVRLACSAAEGFDNHQR